MLLFDSIDIWKLDIDINKERFFIKNKDILSQEELIQLQNFKFSKDKRRYLFSHIAMRLLLARYTNIHPKKISYLYNKYGKPSVNSNIFFNLSHSHNIALIAFSQIDLGIDIEFKKVMEDYTSISKLVFSTAENKYIFAKNIRERFYEIWTKKEALLKVWGTGLINNLDEVEVLSNLYQQDNNTWQFQRIANEKDYIGHIAYKCEGTKKINIHDFNYLSANITSYANL